MESVKYDWLHNISKLYMALSNGIIKFLLVAYYRQEYMYKQCYKKQIMLKGDHLWEKESKRS
jgi:hypothetical protein